MALQLTAPIFKTFTLDRTDEKYPSDGSTTVLIKQAAQGEHERRQDLFSVLERKYSQLDPGEVSLVQRLSMEELKRLEVWLTLCECNILNEKGKELFPSKKAKGQTVLNMTQQQFNEAWSQLPPSVAQEIHEKVLEVNLMWAGMEGEE